MSEHEIAAGIHLWIAQGGAWDVAAALRNDLAAQTFEVLWTNSHGFCEDADGNQVQPGPGWVPFAACGTGDGAIAWRRAVPK